MPTRTAHLLSIPALSAAHTQLLNGVFGAWQAQHLPGGAVARVYQRGSAGLEIMLLDVTEEGADELARALSAVCTGRTFTVHHRVNLAWASQLPLPRPGGTPESEAVHLIELPGPIWTVRQALEQKSGWDKLSGVHTQGSERFSQIVLPVRLEDGVVNDVAQYITQTVASAQVTFSARGYWVRNGSVHHDVKWFRGGQQIKTRQSEVWS